MAKDILTLEIPDDIYQDLKEGLPGLSKKRIKIIDTGCVRCGTPVAEFRGKDLLIERIDDPEIVRKGLRKYLTGKLICSVCIDYEPIKEQIKDGEFRTTNNLGERFKAGKALSHE